MHAERDRLSIGAAREGGVNGARGSCDVPAF